MINQIQEPLNRYILASNIYFGGRMLTASFIIYYHIDKGVNLNTFNWLIIIFLTTNLVFDYPCGVIADYIGRHKSIYLSCIFWALFPLFLLLAPNFYGLLLGYICYSLGISLYGGAHQAILHSLSNEGNVLSKETFQKLGKYNSFALFLFSSLGFLLYWQSNSYIYPLLLQSFIFMISLIIYQTISYPSYGQVNQKKHSSSLLALYNNNKRYIFKYKSFFLAYIFIYSAFLLVQVPAYLYWQTTVEYIANKIGIVDRNIIIFFAQIYFLLVAVIQFKAHSIYLKKFNIENIAIIRSAISIVIFCLLIIFGIYIIDVNKFIPSAYCQALIIFGTLIVLQSFLSPAIEAVNSLFTSNIADEMTSSLLSFVNSVGSLIQIIVLFLLTRIYLSFGHTEFSFKNTIVFYWIAIAFMFPVFWLVSISIDQVEFKNRKEHNNELY